MKNFKKMERVEVMDSRFDCEPISNFVKTNRSLLFEKEMKLAVWYHKYNLTSFRTRLQKLNELLGKGSKIHSTYVWGFKYKDTYPIMIYYSKEGLSMEAVVSSEPFIFQILDEVLETL